SAIENMIEQGLIESSGKGKDRTFIFSERVYRENKKGIQYVRQTDIDRIRFPEMVMKLANTQNGVVNKHDVVELLKVTPAQAYAILESLCKEGKLELLCGGRYSKYGIVGKESGQE
ncbi:MAG: AAA family ATPase, partial [Clostridia bacterium]|nr:AAA family ATPase [Clostridia bacterium]